jgi:hypothetical protein
MEVVESSVSDIIDEVARDEGVIEAGRASCIRGDVRVVRVKSVHDIY